MRSFFPKKSLEGIKGRFFWEEILFLIFNVIFFLSIRHL